MDQEKPNTRKSVSRNINQEPPRKLTNNPYINFIMEFKRRSENRHLTGTELFRAAAKSWRKLSHEERLPYINAAKKQQSSKQPPVAGNNARRVSARSNTRRAHLAGVSEGEPLKRSASARRASVNIIYKRPNVAESGGRITRGRGRPLGKKNVDGLGMKRKRTLSGAVAAVGRKCNRCGQSHGRFRNSYSGYTSSADTMTDNTYATNTSRTFTGSDMSSRTSRTSF